VTLSSRFSSFHINRNASDIRQIETRLDIEGYLSANLGISIVIGVEKSKYPIVGENCFQSFGQGSP
jgi:hypothetical protein